MGGWWGGAAIRRAADDVHRTFSFAAQVRDGAAHNLYAQRPDHLAPLRDHWPQPTRPPRPERRLPNNVYSDREGNVFRHPEGGTWEQHHPEGWRRVQPPAPSTPHELPRMDSLHQELQLESQVRDRGRRDEEEYRRPSAPQPRSPPPSRTPPQR